MTKEIGDIEKIKISKLKKMVNPFDTSIWIGCEKPITIKEIKKFIETKSFITPEEHQVNLTIPGKYPVFIGATDPSSREDHIKRIAWLVENYSDEYPIDIDFGVPALGVYFTVEDGHHRLAAAIYRKEKYISSTVSGSVTEIMKFI